MHPIDAITWIVVAILTVLILALAWHYVVFVGQVAFGLALLWLLWRVVRGFSGG